MGGLGPDERLWMSIVLGEIGSDSALQVDDRAEDAATEALAGHFRKEVLNRMSQEAEVGVKWKVQRG